MNKLRNYFLILFYVIIALVSIYCFLTSGEVSSAIEFDEEVVVHFVDVDQGDCAIIQTPIGNIIIDAGLYKSDNYSVTETVSYIDSLGISDFAYAIFTHPHSDHIGGAGTVISKYNVDTVILPDAVNTSTPFDKMLEAIENKGCSVIEGKAGVSVDFGDAKIELLAPVRNDYDSLNNASIVTKFTYGDVSFLFTGDAEILAEYDMLERDKSILDSTILKVAHHGSSTSSSSEFVEAVSPEVAVYSCGKNNEYGHPHREVIALMDSVGVQTYRTDKDGNIVITTDGEGYAVYTEK